MACNGVGTPRLLLNSTSARFPNGLANRSGLVGRNLMLHPWGAVAGLFDEPLGSNFGPQGCCILSQQFYETDTSRGFVRGYNMQITRRPTRRHGPGRNGARLDPLGRGPPRRLR